METDLEKYRIRLSRFIALKIEDEGVVEELTNDVLAAGMNAWEDFGHRCKDFSFLCGIAKHKIIDYYRKKKLKTILFSASPVFEEIADEALNPERDVLKNELKDEIEATMQELREGYGKILRLKYVDGLKSSKIAEILKMSIKAVESRLVRARKQFQTSWNYDQKESQKHRKDRDFDRD
jgi:RNA polymerase sigma factor (sigma-70 family)